MSLTYLIGEPGVGKSATMRHLAPPPVEAVPKPLWHTIAADGSIHLGNPAPRDPRHPGTDTLSYSALPVALSWLPSLDPEIVVYGEGDRLAHPRLWSAMAEAGHAVVVVRLTGPAEQRRASRGTRQSKGWLKGRATRVERLAREWPTLRVDSAGASPAEVAATIRGLIA